MEALGKENGPKNGPKRKRKHRNNRKAYLPADKQIPTEVDLADSPNNEQKQAQEEPSRRKIRRKKVTPNGGHTELPTYSQPLPSLGHSYMYSPSVYVSQVIVPLPPPIVEQRSHASIVEVREVGTETEREIRWDLCCLSLLILNVLEMPHVLIVITVIVLILVM